MAVPAAHLEELALLGHEHGFALIVFAAPDVDVGLELGHPAADDVGDEGAGDLAVGEPAEADAVHHRVAGDGGGVGLEEDEVAEVREGEAELHDAAGAEEADLGGGAGELEAAAEELEDGDVAEAGELGLLVVVEPQDVVVDGDARDLEGGEGDGHPTVEVLEVGDVGAVLGELGDVEAQESGVAAAAEDHGAGVDAGVAAELVGRGFAAAAAILVDPHAEDAVEVGGVPAAGLEGGAQGGLCVGDLGDVAVAGELPVVERALEAALLDLALAEVGAEVRAVTIEDADVAWVAGGAEGDELLAVDVEAENLTGPELLLVGEGVPAAEEGGGVAVDLSFALAGAGGGVQAVLGRQFRGERACRLRARPGWISWVGIAHVG